MQRYLPRTANITFSQERFIGAMILEPGYPKVIDGRVKGFWVCVVLSEKL
jgi:hypothetical protein